jgi:hypothetical protein
MSSALGHMSSLIFGTPFAALGYHFPSCAPAHCRAIVDRVYNEVTNGPNQSTR